MKESLLGTHDAFQQQIGGIDVDHGEIHVSIARADGRVYRVFNTVIPVGVAVAPRAVASLTENAAYDAAWNRH